jgi:site-specific DNA-methyltransferase (adenine-specific)
MGGMEVKAVFMDAIDPLFRRQIELEENIKRKAFTPAEEVLAMKEIHEMKQRQYGVNPRAGGWKIEDTAALLGITTASAAGTMRLADVIDAFPQLREAKTKSEITRAAKCMEKMAANVIGLGKHEAHVAANLATIKMDNADALVWMKGLPDAFANILLTDPPYGIDYQDVGGTLGGNTGSGLTTSGFKFDDSTERAIGLYKELATESYRFTTVDAHAYVFLGPEHFWTVRSIFTDAGWSCHIKPLIWIKRAVGQCNVPSQWPSSCYEMMLYARKPATRLVTEGRPDWVDFAIVNPSDRLHPSEKPVPLLEDLISRSTTPGMTLVDPFAGSGASLEAGHKQKLICYGCEILPEAYAAALGRLGGIT